MIWESEHLFNKAAAVFQKASSLERSDFEYPLLLTMGFELLSRAALAKVHPALLADPSDGENILFAFGFAKTAKPKSIPIRTVFRRLCVIIPSFSEDDFKFATSIMDARNAEVNSAENAFRQFPVSAWYAPMLRLSELLLQHLGKTFDDLLGLEEGKMAQELVRDIGEKTKGVTLAEIERCKRAFLALSKDEQLIRASRPQSHYIRERDWKSHIEQCPSCGGSALVYTNVIKYIDSAVGEEDILERAIVQPIQIRCSCCGLKLSGYGAMAAAGLMTQRIAENSVDPVDYYGIEFDPSEHVDSDYGND
jgi:hypothetical protein